MKLKSLYVLIFIFLGLLSYIYFFERHIPSTQEKIESRKRVFSFKTDDIGELTIKNKHGFFELKKIDKNNWVIVNDKGNIRADSVEINAILNELQFMEFGREISSKEVQSASLGLDNPHTEIKFNNGKSAYCLKFGEATSLGDNIYACAQINNKINYYVLQTTVKEMIEKEYNSLRDKKVLGEMLFIPNYIELEKGDSKYILEFLNAKWNIKYPIERKADEKTVRNVINAAESLGISEFVDDSPNADFVKYGLQNPDGKLVLKNADRIVTLYIGNQYDNGKKIYIRNNFENSVYGADSVLINNLFPDLFELSTKQFFFMNEEEISDIKINYLIYSFIIKHKNDDWFLSQPVEIKLDNSSVSNLIKNLNEYLITEYIDESSRIQTIKEELKNTVYNITVIPYRNETGIINLAIYIDKDLNAYVSKNDDKYLYKIKIDQDKKLPSGFMELADKQIFNINMLNLEKITFSRQGKTITFSKSNNDWFIGGNKISQDKADKILDIVQDIKVKKFINQKTDLLLNEYNLKSAQNKFQFEINDKDNGIRQTIIFQTGISKDGLLYSTLDNYPLIFAVEEKIISGLIETLQGLENI